MEIGKLRCGNIEVIQADATVFVPPPDVSIMYLYSPFGPTVLPKVLDNIHQSLEACPRDLLVIRKNPNYFELEAARRDWLSKQSEPAGLFKRTYVFYRAALSSCWPAVLPQVSVRLGGQYALQMAIHFQVVGAGNPGDVDSEQGPQLAQGAVELSLIRRPIA